MSTLKVNDIIEATSGGGKIFPARAWVNFNMTSTYTLYDSGGVSSISDTGTGKFTVNLSNAFLNVHYVASGTLDNARRALEGEGTRTTTADRMASRQTDGSGFSDGGVTRYVAHGSA